MSGYYKVTLYFFSFLSCICVWIYHHYNPCLTSYSLHIINTYFSTSYLIYNHFEGRKCIKVNPTSHTLVRGLLSPTRLDSGGQFLQSAVLLRCLLLILRFRTETVDWQKISPLASSSIVSICCFSWWWWTECLWVSDCWLDKTCITSPWTLRN